MRLCKVQLPSGKVEVGVLKEEQVHILELGRLDGPQTLADILHSANRSALLEVLLERVHQVHAVDDVRFLPPVDRQEIWAAGVTYKRSKVAREQESAGAARFYDLVYTAQRPELFFKAPAWRAVGHGGAVRIRRDARWSVPEPEVALVISPTMQIVGYTIGNDMSSRDIEGENPLYLPQAKFYDGSCALGPAVTLPDAFPPPDQARIALTIRRAGAVVFHGHTAVSAMARAFEDLVSWLGRETSFPDGAVLLTGTGIVPPDEFTLATGDEVAIEVSGVGTLVNTVA